MKESVKIVQQTIEKLSKCKGDDVLVRGKIAPPNRVDMKKSMEALIIILNFILKVFMCLKAKFMFQLKHLRENLEFF